MTTWKRQSQIYQKCKTYKLCHKSTLKNKQQMNNAEHITYTTAIPFVVLGAQTSHSNSQSLHLTHSFHHCFVAVCSSWRKSHISTARRKMRGRERIEIRFWVMLWDTDKDCIQIIKLEIKVSERNQCILTYELITCDLLNSKGQAM